MYRARPVWIETRVPARLDCPHCKVKERAALNPDSVQNAYEYICEACTRRFTFTLKELNEPVLSVMSASLKRITA